MSSPPSTTDHEKKVYHDSSSPVDAEVAIGQVTDYGEDNEVFRKDGKVNFRTVEWQYVCSHRFTPHQDRMK